jgi:hypothetical protein
LPLHLLEGQMLPPQQVERQMLPPLPKNKKLIICLLFLFSLKLFTNK